MGSKVMLALDVLIIIKNTVFKIQNSTVIYYQSHNTCYTFAPGAHIPSTAVPRFSPFRRFQHKVFCKNLKIVKIGVPFTMVRYCSRSVGFFSVHDKSDCNKHNWREVDTVSLLMS